MFHCFRRQIIILSLAICFRLTFQALTMSAQQGRSQPKWGPAGPGANSENGPSSLFFFLRTRQFLLNSVLIFNFSGGKDCWFPGPLIRPGPKAKRTRRPWAPGNYVQRRPCLIAPYSIKSWLIKSRVTYVNGIRRMHVKEYVKSGTYITLYNKIVQ